MRVVPKVKWLNYLLVLTLFNVTLHLCYVYFLLQAHDSMDHTANNIHTFEQALLLCKREMIYREAGVAIKQALGRVSNSSSERNSSLLDNLGGNEPEVSVHPANISRLRLDMEPSQAAYDRWRLFKVQNFAVRATDWPDLSRQKVCIGTHASVERMHWIVQMANRWNGPISVALFVPDVEFSIAETFIEYLRNCYPAVKRQVAFHLIYPDQFPPRRLHHLARLLDSIPCESPHVVIGNLLTLRPVEMTGWRETLRYPQNLARNTAKAGCSTSYTIVPDADMIPVPGMAEQLETFLEEPEQEACQKCAYVVPVYEIKSTIGRDSMPKTKEELLLLVERYYARRFHQTVYLLNQLSSNLDRWEALNHSNSTQVAFQVTNYLFKYEPLYVARAETPVFDERFIGFGMTRNTQAYEMYVAGYQFLVLNNLFMNHWGLQKRETRPRWRQMQHLLNNRLFKGFAKEIAARYNRDPYNMLEKIELPGFWGVKNVSEINLGVPGQADLLEIYKAGGGGGGKAS